MTSEIWTEGKKLAIHMDLCMKMGRWKGLHRTKWGEGEWKLAILHLGARVHGIVWERGGG